MRKDLWVLSVLLVFFCASALPANAELTKRVNPVHERRKAAYEKKKKVFKGIKLSEQEAKRVREAEAREEALTALLKKQAAEDAKKKAAQKPDTRPALVKEFDKDNDGVISYEEMDAAKAAGKGNRLKSQLAAEKAKRKEKMLKKGPEEAKSEIEAETVTVQEPVVSDIAEEAGQEGEMKEVVVPNTVY